MYRKSHMYKAKLIVLALLCSACVPAAAFAGDLVVADAFAITNTHICALEGGALGTYPLPQGSQPVSAAGIAACIPAFITFTLCVETTAPSIECVLAGVQTSFPIPAPVVARPLSWTNGPQAGVLVFTATTAYVISGGVVTPVPLNGTYTGNTPGPNGVTVATTAGNRFVFLAGGVTIVPFGVCSGPPTGQIAMNIAPCRPRIAAQNAGWGPSGIRCISAQGASSVAGGPFGLRTPPTGGMGRCGGTVDCPPVALPYFQGTAHTELAPNRLSFDPSGACLNMSGRCYGGIVVQANTFSSLVLFTNAPAIDVVAGGVLQTYPLPGAAICCAGADCKVSRRGSELVCNMSNEAATDFHIIVKGRLKPGDITSTDAWVSDSTGARINHWDTGAVAPSPDGKNTMICWMNNANPIPPGGYCTFTVETRSGKSIHVLKKNWSYPPTSTPGYIPDVAFVNPEITQQTPGGLTLCVMVPSAADGGVGAPVVVDLFYRVSHEVIPIANLSLADPLISALAAIFLGSFTLQPGQPVYFNLAIPTDLQFGDSLIIEAHEHWSINGNTDRELFEFPPLQNEAVGWGFDPSQGFTGSANGTNLSGQQGWYLPAASTEHQVFAYAGNVAGVPANAQGGPQFAAGIGTTTFARAQHDADWGTGAATVSYDVSCSFTGTGSAAQNLGSFSTQPDTDDQYTHLFTWVNPAQPTQWNAGHVVYDANGVEQPASPGVARGVLAGPAWGNLPVNHWYRFTTTIDWSANRIVTATIQDLTNSGPVVSAYPADWYLSGGAANRLRIPSALRFFAGSSVPGNAIAYDNVVLDVSSVRPPLPSNVPGDTNGDLSVNAADVPSFAEALLADVGDALTTDVNGDGLIDAQDIQPFVSQVIGSPPPGAGACCLPDQSCHLMNQSRCTANGGRYAGDGSSCSPYPCPQVPGNDECAGAEPMNCNEIRTFDNSFATTNSADPVPGAGCAHAAVFRSAWYRFVAQDTTATVATCSSTPIDTVLQVFAFDDPQNPCGSLRAIACDDDGCGAHAGMSSATLSGLTIGSTYYVQVGGYGPNARGVIDVTVMCP